LTVKLDGKEMKAIMRDLQRHVTKPKITHMDLQRVSATETIHMQIPLHFVGEDVAPGVKLEGGQITHNMSELEVMCKAQDLPEFIEVDLSQMALNDVIHVSDLKLPAGVESVALSHGEEHDLPVAAIHKKGAMTEEAPEEEAAGEEAEGGEGEAAAGEGE
jgi:large subunit ribosomal protein L25